MPESSSAWSPMGRCRLRQPSTSARPARPLSLRMPRGTSLLDYLHVRLAEGMVAMASEDFALALQHFGLCHPWRRNQTTPSFSPFPTSGRPGACAISALYDDALGFAPKKGDASRSISATHPRPPSSRYWKLAGLPKGQAQRSRAPAAEADRAQALPTISSPAQHTIRLWPHRRRQGRQEGPSNTSTAPSRISTARSQHLHLARSLVKFAVVERP